MRAALYRAGGRIDLTEVADPPVPAPGEVLVSPRATGICGSDLHVFRDEAPPLSFAGGHEIAGEVAAVGPGVTRLARGDRVAIEPIIRCGVCPFCRSGRTNLCDRMEFIGFKRHGGFAERILVPAEIAWPLPADLPWPVASLAEPLAVALRAARLAGVSGDTVVVILGAGSVGLLCGVAARSLGARRILIAARYPHQIAAAEALGLAAIAVPAGTRAARPLTQALGERPDVAIEAVGGRSAEPVADAINLVRRGGTVVLTGVFTADIPVPLVRIVRKEVVVRGSYCYGHDSPRADFPAALDLLAREASALAGLVTHRYPWADIRAAFVAASDKASRAIKVQVEN